MPTADTRTIGQVLADYDVTESKTFLMLATCHADRVGPRLVVTSMGDISDSDWLTVLTVFDALEGDYDYDFAIIDGGVHVISFVFHE